jgi:hypothetical protein
MTTKVRPTRPWYIDPEIVGGENQLEVFKTPAAVIAYVYSQLSPEATEELLAGIVDAGASPISLCRDAIELAEMGHEELAEMVLEIAENARDAKSISETDFLPPSMQGADEIIVKATAAITGMKVGERCEGVPVQLREA